VSLSLLKDKDITAAAAATYTGATGGPTVAATLYEITSNRIHGAYTFPFGLKLGMIYDNSKLKGSATAPAFGSELKKNVWSVPISWNTGPHTIFGTYARASKLKGTINNVDIGSINVTPGGIGATAQNIGGNSGARFMAVGYQFDLSKRTTLHVSFAQITNDSLAGYDFFSNTVGMANGNFGADPRIYALGLRHAF
jgi:predicted porin